MGELPLLVDDPKCEVLVRRPYIAYVCVSIIYINLQVERERERERKREREREIAYMKCLDYKISRSYKYRDCD